ncbi:MAG TPA: hypothetical protein IGR64_15415 [Leptolyngbyaceae cyanobacterium M65_K2018_010]|nr:hypothetical protein [Leptolyngbyaceae cyanobacterium M65_K2018_010]
MTTQISSSLPVHSVELNLGAEAPGSGSDQKWLSNSLDLTSNSVQFIFQDNPSAGLTPAREAPTLGSDGAPNSPAVLAVEHLPSEPLEPLAGLQGWTASAAGADQTWWLAQTQGSSSAEGVAQNTSSTGDEETVWHFLFQPYVVVPVYTNANIRVNNVGVDVNPSLGDILSSLDLALLGRFEGWYANQGFNININYFAVGQSVTRNFNIPSELEGILPSSLTASASADVLKADLMYAYRFTDPPEGGYGRGFTEFDLPPLTFDLMGGLRFYYLAPSVSLTSNLGRRELSRSGSYFFGEPVIRGRLRWNTSDYLAVKLDANASGFGLINNLFTFSVAGLLAVEWMFSGNTSLEAGWEVNYFDFQRNNGATRVNATATGPYLSFIFRF